MPLQTPLNKTIQEACDDALFCCQLVDRQTCLKKTHSYYFRSRARWQSQVCIDVTSLCGWVMMIFMLNVSTLRCVMMQVIQATISLPAIRACVSKGVTCISIHTYISQGTLYITLITQLYTVKILKILKSKVRKLAAIVPSTRSKKSIIG